MNYLINLFKAPLFTNKQNQIVYFDEKSKISYIIKDQDIGQLRLFMNRLWLSCIIGVVSTGFKIDLYMAVIISIAVYVMLEIAFKKNFLSKLTFVNNTNIKDLKPYKNEIRKSTDSKPKAILVSVLYILIGILLVVNAIDQQMNQMMIGFCVVFCIIAICLGLYKLYLTLFKK